MANALFYNSLHHLFTNWIATKIILWQYFKFRILNSMVNNLHEAMVIFTFYKENFLRIKQIFKSKKNKNKH